MTQSHRGDAPHILIIDDEERILKSLRRILMHDYTVTVMQSARDACAMLVAGARAVDIVLCDLMMPDMTGMQVFREVTAAHPDMDRRFVFMTGGAVTEEAQQFYAQNKSRTLDKPLMPDTLHAAVADALAKLS